LRVLVSILFAALSATAFADNAIDAGIEAALAAEGRPQADIDRDRNRRPLETLKFFGMTDDMTVIELFPGGGWYTRLLGPALAQKGQLYVALGTGRVSDSVLTEPGFEAVKVLETSAEVSRNDATRIYAITDFEFDVDDVDMVVTFRNLHNFDPESRARVNEQVYAALKPGGLYGVIDHTRRHMEPANAENRRRIDPVLVIRELVQMGFEFVDYSDLHYRADDELEYEVGRRSVSGNTDRFTLLFRKPE